MPGDLFDSPWKILIIALLIIVLFGSKKLPGAARSLGQSMRILKREVQGLHEDEPETAAVNPQPELAAATPAQPAQPAQSAQQAQIEALQQQIRDMQRASAMDTPTVNAGASADPQRNQPS
jgi:sec-independent protein translocase protein TatA